MDDRAIVAQLKATLGITGGKEPYAEQGRLIGLDLSGLGITYLPGEVGQLCCLKIKSGYVFRSRYPAYLFKQHQRVRDLSFPSRVHLVKAWRKTINRGRRKRSPYPKTDHMMINSTNAVYAPFPSLKELLRPILQ